MTHMTAALDPLAARTEDRARRVREYAASSLFSRTYEEGMALVEEAAAYLDGPGREDSRRLPRTAAVAYAGESMRLTTRLMDLASWLLVQRSVRDGEMTPDGAADEKYRLRAEAGGVFLKPGAEDIPPRLRDLLIHSEQVYERARRVDEGLYRRLRAADPVGKQVDRLREAFEPRREAG